MSKGALEPLKKMVVVGVLFDWNRFVETIDFNDSVILKKHCRR